MATGIGLLVIAGAASAPSLARAGADPATARQRHPDRQRHTFHIWPATWYGAIPGAATHSAEAPGNSPVFAS